MARYIAPEQVPIKYGGLIKENDSDFTTSDVVTEVTIKLSSKHTIEIPATENGLFVWELRVLRWEVSYREEFYAKIGEPMCLTVGGELQGRVLCKDWGANEAARDIQGNEGNREDLKRIINMLQVKSISCSVKRKGRVFWIGFQGSTADLFWTLVEPYIL